MGLDANGTRFLLYAKTRGVDFSDSATIGRQGLHLTPAQLSSNFNEFGAAIDNAAVQSIFDKQSGYAEAFLHYLGARTVHSFDNSNYENATHVHNMNDAVPDELDEKYSMVLDGGSLEHVFNFPVAIQNCMRMLKVGGHFLGITPGNNFLGHGFYQFSPELYFSTFTPTNGFQLLDVIAFEDRRKTKWFEVQNPSSVGGRVTLINRKPLYLLIIAKRINRSTIFASAPQQSDYVSMWNNSEDASTRTESSSARRSITTGKTNTPQCLFRYTSRLFSRRKFGFEKRFFREMVPSQNG